MLADGREVLEELTSGFSSFGHPFIDKPAVIFDDSRDAFKGNIFVKEEDGSYTIRYRRDEFAYFSFPVLEELERLDKLLYKHSLMLKLSAGDGYIINNRRWLHGRKDFSGEREFLRLLVSDKCLDKKGIPVYD